MKNLVDSREKSGQLTRTGERGRTRISRETAAVPYAPCPPPHSERGREREREGGREGGRESEIDESERMRESKSERMRENGIEKSVYLSSKDGFRYV